MTYEKPVFYGSYRFDLDKNPLTKTQNEFLESKDSKEYNKSQYEITCRNKLDESLRTITWIFNYCHKLKKSDIYEIFNAKSMEYFVNSLLKNIKGSFYNDEYIYDFRTSELARLFFLISIDYLKKSPQFKNASE